MCLQSLHPSVLWGLLISNDLWPPLISMGFLLQYIKVWNSTNYYICCTLLNHFHVLTYIDLKWPLASTNVWRFMYKTHWRGSADGTNSEDLASFTLAYMYHATKFSDFELHWPQNQMISTYTNFNTILVLFKVQYRATVYIMYEVSPNIDFCSYHVYKACRLTSNELWHPQISIQLQYELPSTVALSC